MQPQNNLVTEIILGIVAGLIAIAAPVLLYLGTINFNGALAVWGIAGTIVGVKLALNAPSPSQQNQLNAQNVNLQQLVQYALSVLQPQAPVAPPQGQQTASQPRAQVFVPAPVDASTPGPGVAPAVVAPGSSAVPGTPPIQTQFKTIQIPDVSLPTIPVVGQGIPLGQ